MNVKIDILEYYFVASENNLKMKITKEILNICINFGKVKKNFNQLTI